MQEQEKADDGSHVYRGLFFPRLMLPALQLASAPVIHITHDSAGLTIPEVTQGRS